MRGDKNLDYSKYGGIKMKKILIYSIIVLFLTLGWSKNCLAQTKDFEDFWVDANKIYILIRDFQFKLKNDMRVYEFKRGLSEIKVKFNGFKDDWEKVRKEIGEKMSDDGEYGLKFKKDKNYKLSPEEKESIDIYTLQWAIEAILASYGTINSINDLMALNEEYAELKHKLPEQEEEHKKEIAEKIREIDKNIDELKKEIRKYHK